MDDRSLYAEPDLYDLLFRGWVGDLGHYAALAVEAGGDVLECGVGTGRVALHLARAGHRVHGVDADAAMLAALGRHLAGEAEAVRARVTFERGDMARMELGRRFALVIAPFNAVAHLDHDDDLVAFLENVRRHLGPGGVFAFDAWQPDATTLVARVADSPRFRDPRTGEPARCTETHRWDPATRRFEMELAVSGLDEGPPERLRLSLRVRPAAELPALLGRAGLAVRREVDLGDMAGFVCGAPDRWDQR